MSYSGARVIEHLVRALFARKLASTLCSRGPEHAQAGRARNLCRPTPTAPLAPWINTVSPGTARPFSNSARHAVTYGTPTPAPSVKVMRDGRWWTCATVHNARVARKRQLHGRRRSR